MAIPEEQKIKLESMQIKGIRAMIWQNIEKDDIESRLLQIKKQNYTNDLQKFVNTQSRAVLIELIEMSPEIYPQTIDAAYEKYRYGLKPGFTLFWAKRSNDISFDKDSLETKIKEFISAQKYGEDDKYKNLEFVSIIEFGGTYEISLSYLQKFNYINEEGEFTYIYMMKECFVWVGIDNDADVMAKDIKITNKGTTFKLVIGKSSIMVNTILLGEKNIYNILESAALAYNLGLSLNEIKQGILNIKPIEHRLEIKQYNNITVIDDSFNANPEGAKNALEVLSLMEGKKIVITPGMIEMGSSQEELNFTFGKNIAEVADEVYLIGENQTKSIKNGIESVNKKFNIHVYNRFIKAYNDIIKATGDEKIVILIENDLPDAYMEG